MLRFVDHLHTFILCVFFHLLATQLHIVNVLITGGLGCLEHTIQLQCGFSQRTDIGDCQHTIHKLLFQHAVALAQLLIFFAEIQKHLQQIPSSQSF